MWKEKLKIKRENSTNLYLKLDSKGSTDKEYFLLIRIEDSVLTAGERGGQGKGDFRVSIPINFMSASGHT